MRRLATALTIAFPPLLCQAQVPEALGRCLVANIAPADRADLAQWVFLSMAVNPDVSRFAGADSEAVDAVARKVGALFTRTMRDDCAKEVEEAARAPGPPVVKSAINFFSQLGVQELMVNREVLARLFRFSNFADREGIDRAAHPK